MMPAENNGTSIPTSIPATEPMTDSDAAARLGLKVATLRAWRHQGRGPTFVPADPVLVGLNTLQHWLWQRLQAPLASSGAA